MHSSTWGFRRLEFYLGGCAFCHLLIHSELTLIKTAPNVVVTTSSPEPCIKHPLVRVVPSFLVQVSLDPALCHSCMAGFELTSPGSSLLLPPVWLVFCRTHHWPWEPHGRVHMRQPPQSRVDSREWIVYLQGALGTVLT